MRKKCSKRCIVISGSRYTCHFPKVRMVSPGIKGRGGRKEEESLSGEGRKEGGKKGGREERREGRKWEARKEGGGKVDTFLFPSPLTAPVGLASPVVFVTGPTAANISWSKSTV